MSRSANASRRTADVARPCRRGDRVADMDAQLDLGRTARNLCRWPSARRAEAPLFIAMRAPDPLQDLLFFVRDPWPWGKPHEAAGIHRTSKQLGSRVAH